MYAILTAVSLAVLGQADAEKKEGAEFARVQQKKWNEFYGTEAAAYTITLDGDRQKKLRFHPEPVLLWSNPVRWGETNGAVFVWTYEGRVEAVGTVFSHLARQDPEKRYIAHSFHSLALRHKKAVLWKFENDLPMDGTKSPYISRRTELRNRVIP